MPDVVRKDFVEALQIFASSPRASAALLRLAIQRICIELGLPGKKLDDDIGELVTRGLPKQIQQSLDIVRVIGNQQVHPGVLDLNDEPAIARSLFSLVNMIVEYMFSKPREIEELYASLPAGALEHIQRRDS